MPIQGAMPYPVPAQPKIYHIVHVDRLASIAAHGLWCDQVMIQAGAIGTTIGMNSIKKRRLEQCRLTSYPGIFVGHCVPFYFCPRSIMLYLISRQNHPELAYRGGQGPIVHLEADLHGAVAWAAQVQRPWAFTLSNAGALYFEDRSSLASLGEINWPAVQTIHWADAALKEAKQAEFLMHQSFPWHLIERIGVQSAAVHHRIVHLLQTHAHRPRVDVMPGWYY